MKIGIITIHRILNYGSSLQAYALQHYIEKAMGFDAEIIDYIFPNEYHKLNKKVGLGKNIRIKLGLLRKYVKGDILRRKKRFKAFWNNYYKLSKLAYNNIGSIMSNPPIYDLYITGSDQVWNYRTVKNDPVMYCRFAKEGVPRVAFGSSFATQSFPKELYSETSLYLNSYNAIGVREKSSLNILKQINVNSTIPQAVTCDPTLLIEQEEYDEIANDSNVNIETPYILCYFLDYAFNPEPSLSDQLNKVQTKYNLPIIQLGKKKIKYKGNIRQIDDIGPCEFVYLFKHAKYVVTSSFHGVMFSLIYRKPFMAIVPDSFSEDCRIKDVLDLLELKDCYVETGNVNKKPSAVSPYDEKTERLLHDYITNSKIFLNQHIQ